MAVGPLFDTYAMVDWSASAVPKTGADSIWLAIARRDHAEAAPVNLPTRAAAALAIEQLLDEECASGRRVLIGFDFPLGYAQGFAARLSLAGPPWRAVWQEIAGLLTDGADNDNNRFDVADTLNRRVSGGAFPFWGRPAAASFAALEPRHHRRHALEGLAERRLVDCRVPRSQPGWKLLGAGAAGGQALTGIPVLERLKRRFGPALLVWPFETGLDVPGGTAAITVTEIYPSLFPVAPAPGEVKDSAQTRTTARHFAALDQAGSLAALFAGDPALTEAERAVVIAEEGWVLGVTGPVMRDRGDAASVPWQRGRRPAVDETAPAGRASRPPVGEAPAPPFGLRPVAAAAHGDYLRDPAAIYAKSFAIARAETDLTGIPPDLHALALRVVHAAADPGLVRDLVWSPGAAEAGRQALAAGAPVLADVEMVARGVTRALLPAGNEVICTLRDPAVAALAARLGTTRSAAALELWRGRMEGAVVAIGNAPTALFHLLEMVAAGAPRPALVLGFPVGFVGAAEAKAALAANRLGLAYVALSGRRGGSALAAAAVNALAGARSA
jgi:precorrin-8X/cobalt-precorrin-8 methylmutase